MEPLEFIIRLLAATAAGAVVGLEREINNKSAGLRTNTLVSIGAAIYVLISLELLNEGEGDASRIVGQIITGIGFLGAGVILHRGPSVHGLTTAATIWCSAALGCLAALAMYWQLIIAALLVLMVNLAFKLTDRWFAGKQVKSKDSDDKNHFE
ncbi:MAG TPA: MgtC/SapB family protein [Proteiniphilum sp.]|nr:MgtC/SapB family protein [Proteiniphilum sp.]HPD86819.1 MgtC/SapB family protein [Proteiniphilum sp.]HPJ49456.1 MgtC/SapB family protein [Proteiniphilum sp.]HPR20423.1 MgtC/SapB family protein [Proteiniphilum sp.]